MKNLSTVEVINILACIAMMFFLGLQKNQVESIIRLMNRKF